ncbi:hypothetical protein [Virgibacillus sp. L01]|uniref:hypothetical protein n=1 Tax=Virgibacillus sp. L01 TaxID=3457429 RepID=UPI003FCF7290
MIKGIWTYLAKYIIVGSSLILGVMMLRIILFTTILVFTIAGCDKQDSTQSVQEQISDEVKYNIEIPNFQGYVMNFASIKYPPVGKNKIVRLGYTTEKNNLPELTKEEKELLRKGHNMNVLFGNPDSNNDFYIEVSNSETKIVNSEVTTISGEKIQTLTEDKHAVFTINTEEGSYNLNVIFNDEINKQVSYNIAEQLVKQIVH